MNIYKQFSLCSYLKTHFIQAGLLFGAFLHPINLQAQELNYGQIDSDGRATKQTASLPSENANSSQNSLLEGPESIKSGIILPDTKITQPPASTVRDLREDVSSINFNNVGMIEYIRFISRISGKNFVFDDEDLQFNVTIVSEEATSVQNLMSALLQELKIRDLSLIEQGNNIIIHRNPRVKSPARIVDKGNSPLFHEDAELVTRVFRLNTLDPIKASEIIRPLLSDDALIEVLRDSNNLIMTDLVTNVNKVAELITTLDAPNSGITIGQYVVKNAYVESLVDLATRIITPISQGNPFTLVSHAASNSIYVVSNNFIVEKAMAILQNLDSNEGITKIFSLQNLNASQAGEGQKSFLIGPNGYTIGPDGYLRDANGNLVRIGAPGTEGYPADANGFVKAFDNNSVVAGSVKNEGDPLLFAPFGYTIGPDGSLRAPNGDKVPKGSRGTDGYPTDADGNVLAGKGKAHFQGITSSGTLLPSALPQSFPFGDGGIGTEGKSSAIFDQNKELSPGSIGSTSKWSQDLPSGHIERTLFSIYKLRYRRGDQLEIALRKIAFSLQEMGTANIDLLAAINSVQWIESSNALILTGTPTALERLRELIQEIDTPLRQVFIEMLLLATTIEDSLEYGVSINQFTGGSGSSTQALQGFNGNIGAEAANAIDYTTNPPSFGDPGSVFGNLGYIAQVIGTHLTHHGTRFSTISALVKALHQNSKTRILLNPKIITEDNNTATIFVGTTDRYKTQSITNDLGTLVTNNFEFMDVGTTLRVTPLIGNNNVITLDIYQETSNGTSTANTTSSSTSSTDVNLVPVISKSNTTTRVHIPNGFFVILSGMIQDVESRSVNRVPCLGGIPILGAACKQKANEDRKQNLMIFIRPLIIDTDDELESITKRQQDVFHEKSKFRRFWNYEIDEALDQFNIKATDFDEIGCDEGCCT